MGNGLEQGPMTGLQNLGAQAAEREVNLTAVHSDALAMTEKLLTLGATVVRLNDYLMGSKAIDQPEIRSNIEKEPQISAILPSLCQIGSKNLSLANDIQERLNQIAYQLGEGRER